MCSVNIWKEIIVVYVCCYVYICTYTYSYGIWGYTWAFMSLITFEFSTIARYHCSSLLLLLLLLLFLLLLLPHFVLSSIVNSTWHYAIIVGLCCASSLWSKSVRASTARTPDHSTSPVIRQAWHSADAYSYRFFAARKVRKWNARKLVLAKFALAFENCQCKCQFASAVDREREWKVCYVRVLLVKQLSFVVCLWKCFEKELQSVWFSGDWQISFAVIAMCCCCCCWRAGVAPNVACCCRLVLPFS